MLEALIDKVEFEIIVVKKKPAQWSDFERNWYIIVDLDDAELEATVDEVKVYPYRQSFENGTVKKKVVKPEAIKNGIITTADLVEM